MVMDLRLFGNEVRKLAEQTKMSIAEIDAIVQSSNEYMKDVVDSVLRVSGSSR